MSEKSGDSGVSSVDPRTCTVRIGDRAVVLPVSNLEEALDIFSILGSFSDTARVSCQRTAPGGGFIFEYDGIIVASKFSGRDLPTILRLLFETSAAIPDSFTHAYGGSFVFTRIVDSGERRDDFRFLLRVEMRAECRDMVVAWLRNRADSIKPEQWEIFTLD